MQRGSTGLFHSVALHPYSHAQRGGKYETEIQAFLKGYGEQRHIAEIDLASIPTFVALREIWHMALIASMQESAGIQDFDRFIQRTINLLQEWEKSQLKL